VQSAPKALRRILDPASTVPLPERARTQLTARGWRGPGTRQEQARQELVCTLVRFVVPRSDLKAVAIVQGPALSLLGCQLLINLQQRTRFTVDGAST